MAHEIGHLQGERHHNDPSDTPYEYVNTDEWATIMAGGDINEQRLNYWSNPNIAYGGDAMGTPADANNARVLNNTAKVLRDYRTLPSVSNFNFNNPSYTGSSPEFSWDPVPDASYYNVYKCKNDNGNIYDSCFNQTGGQFDSPTSFTDTGEIIKKSYHYGPCDGSS
ncbi:MAG TPA: hypothetical protein VK074_10145, partial [Fodinibius sp.]|nr:hypothetical protein [Fodinibius sp.]